MADACFNKCVSKHYKDGELNVGEMSCTDRCVHKYLEAAQKVGAKLNEINQVSCFLCVIIGLAKRDDIVL
jgi:hypothetical protein